MYNGIFRDDVDGVFAFRENYFGMIDIAFATEKERLGKFEANPPFAFFTSIAEGIVAWFKQNVFNMHNAFVALCGVANGKV